MRMLTLVLALVAIVAGIGGAPAQVYPSRPITMIVPYSAGGPTDTLGAHPGRAHARPRSANRSSSRT